MAKVDGSGTSPSGFARIAGVSAMVGDMGTVCAFGKAKDVRRDVDPRRLAAVAAPAAPAELKVGEPGLVGERGGVARPS
jgi:hypothetical protein